MYATSFIAKHSERVAGAVLMDTRGLERFQRPARFIGGELSEVIGAELQKRQMTFYPNAQLVTIAGAGHQFQWSHPEATLRPIFAYLAAIGF